MKDFAVYYAKFNREKNNEIIEILKKISEDDLYKNRQMFYGSIFNLFCHIIVTSWLHLANMKKILGIKYKPYFSSQR